MHTTLANLLQSARTIASRNSIRNATRSRHPNAKAREKVKGTRLVPTYNIKSLTPLEERKQVFLYAFSVFTHD
jgi:hypothetical protein